MNADIFVIAGTTAVGKTEMALAWAEKNNAEIISADSTLVYRGMDIGTAKPTQNELNRIKHYGINLINPDENFSVFDYVKYAQNAITEILSKGKRICISGGSGFYLKAFYAPIIDELEISDLIKNQVREICQKGNENAKKILRMLNPDGADGFDWENPRRVEKALERCLATKKTIIQLKTEMLQKKGAFENYSKRTILLSREKEDLNARILIRVKEMISAGLIDEVKTLLKNGFCKKQSPASQIIGYRETIDWLDKNKTNLDELIEAIALSTRQLAAKQRKWFRTQLPVNEIIHLQ